VTHEEADLPDRSPTARAGAEPEESPDSGSSQLRLLPIGSVATRRAQAVVAFHRQIKHGSRAMAVLAAALDRDDPAAALVAIERLLATLLAAEHIASAFAACELDDMRRANTHLRRALVAAVPFILRARASQPGPVDEVLRRFG
jgi:hypothetical protein